MPAQTQGLPSWDPTAQAPMLGCWPQQQQQHHLPNRLPRNINFLIIMISILMVMKAGRRRTEEAPHHHRLPPLPTTTATTTTTTTTITTITTATTTPPELLRSTSRVVVRPEAALRGAHLTSHRLARLILLEGTNDSAVVALPCRLLQPTLQPKWVVHVRSQRAPPRPLPHHHLRRPSKSQQVPRSKALALTRPVVGSPTPAAELSVAQAAPAAAVLQAER
mmetsp:Transcript_52949/g.115826  ORF Transcript_52949/g.115826 Transcript_52949/m.115826 type:complete len:221 (-) Transcript_52949:81-743(-)